MIVANNNKWIIATPAKTGSYSLENTLIKSLRVAHKLEANNRVGCEYNGPIKRRILVVRHPLERWSSMFWFARQKGLAERSIFGGTDAAQKSITKAVNDYFELWEYARAAQEHPNFTDTFCEMSAQFGATEHAKTENLQGLINTLGFIYDIRHSNVGKFKHSWAETSKLLTETHKGAILTVYKEDMKRYDYR